jgi:hypothetical protein
VWGLFIAALIVVWVLDRLRHWLNPRKAAAEDAAAEKKRQADLQEISDAVDARLAAYKAAEHEEGGGPTPARLPQPFKGVATVPANQNGGKFAALQQRLQAQRAHATPASETASQAVAPSRLTPEDREELEERQARWRWTVGRNRAFADLQERVAKGDQ